MTVFVAILIAQFLDPVRAGLCLAAYALVVRPLGDKGRPIRYGAVIATAIIVGLAMSALLAAIQVLPPLPESVLASPISSLLWLLLFRGGHKLMRRRKGTA